MFTPEEVRTLRENLYALKATDKTITFTRAFKKHFWHGLQDGRSKCELLRELGYDPELLGSSRVEDISYHIRKEAERPEGVHEGRRIRTPYALGANDVSKLPQAQALRHLQAEVSYLRQEMEFLKNSCRRSIQMNGGNNHGFSKLQI